MLIIRTFRYYLSKSQAFQQPSVLSGNNYFYGLFLKKYKIHILYSPANIGLILFHFPTVVMIQTVAPFDKEMIKTKCLLSVKI